MELWDAYDRAGNRTGETLVRGKPLPEGRYHLVSCVLICHVDGEILLMRRAAEKESYPGWWEIGAGGSALAGEDSLTCARRELAEETGITRGDLTFLTRTVSHDTIYDGYLCVTDWPKDNLTLQPGETTAFRWLDRAAFLEFFYSDQCIPTLHARLQTYVDQTLR